jgi:RimJ/RimL family protein N-acetyltransferase
LKSGQVFRQFLDRSGRNVILRSFRPDDLDPLVDFANQLVSERDENPDLGITFEQRQTRESESKFLSSFLAEMEAGNELSVIAEVGGRLVGNSIVSRGKRSDVNHHGILSISVSKEFRNAGIGFEMLKTLLGECKKEDVRTVELEVFANNPGAIRLYERVGFSQIGRIPKKICRKGRYIDTIVMATELN